MKTHYLLLIITSLLFLQCDEDGPKCKSANHKQNTLFVTAPVNAQIPGGEFVTSVSGNTRIYRWENVISNVCIYDLVTVSFSIITFDDYMPSDFAARAEILWGAPINVQDAPMVLIGLKTLAGTAGANLLPSFVVGSGSFTTVVEISFPTTGNADHDMVLLLGKIRSIGLILKYSED
jgi:hypothetical protein